ncbi:MAG: hypothetical protein R3C97_14120 [Geminicoccaceae bacterium]
MRESSAGYMSAAPCESCNGMRLKPEALCVKVGERHISEITELSIRDAGAWFEAIAGKLTAKQNEIATRILKEINERLGFQQCRPSHLTPSRDPARSPAAKASAIRLASQIGSGLTRCSHVLDEPSTGLHQRDNDQPARDARPAREISATR